MKSPVQEVRSSIAKKIATAYGSFVSADNIDMHNRLWLSMASVVSFSITFVFSLAWSRVYPPEYFGVSALVQVPSGLLAGWSTLAYHNAVQTPEQDREAFDLIWLCLLSLAGFTFLLAIVCVFAPAWISDQLGSVPAVRLWLPVAPLILLCGGISIVLDQWMARCRMFKPMAKALMLQSMLNPLIPALGLFQPEASNFILLGAVFSSVAGCIIRIVASGLPHAIVSYPLIWKRLVKTVVTRWNYPRDILPGSVLTQFSIQLPQIMISRYFDSGMVAQYTRASTLLALPMVVFGNAFSVVFNQKAGKAYRLTGSCRKEFVHTLSMLVATQLPLYLVLGFTAPFLYSWFYGSAWTTAGLLAQPLTLLFFVQAIGSPLSGVLYLGNNTKWDLLWQALRLPTVLIALWVGCSRGNIILALMTFAAANAVLYALYLALSYSLAEKRLQ